MPLVDHLTLQDKIDRSVKQMDKYADRAKNTEEEHERLDTTLAVVLAASVTVLGVLFLSRR